VGGVPLRGIILPCENKSQAVDLTERLVQGRSLHEEIVDILREMAFEGRLKPGERVLVLDFLRERIVSGTPMREAIKIPAAEQLVELRASRGALVADAALKARRRRDVEA
jgi:DNA-binding GntR family transcriptional regulator